MEQTSILTVSTERQDDSVTVHATGEIDLSTVQDFHQAITLARETVTAPATVVVDLTGITFFGSAGVSALVQARHDCAHHEVSLVVMASPVVHRILRVTGLDGVLTTVVPDISSTIRP